MIKGINKQILEVTNTESEYFEKIIFFVRPSSAKVEESKLKSEAEKISLKIRKPPREKRSIKKIAAGGFYALLGVGAGFALSFLLAGVL